MRKTFPVMIIITIMLFNIACQVGPQKGHYSSMVFTNQNATPTQSHKAPPTPVKEFIHAPTLALLSGLDSGMYAFSNPNVARDVVVDKGVAYSASLGGMTGWNLTSGYAMHYTTLQGMSHVSAYTITACDIPERRILVGTQYGLSIYDPSTGLWEKDTLTPVDSKISTSKISRLLCDSKNKQLFIGSNGLGILNLKTQEWKKLTTNEGLASNEIYDLTLNGKEIWVASGMYGVAKISGSQVTLYNKDNGMPDAFSSAIAVGSDKSIWVGTPTGLLQFKNNKWKLFGSDSPSKLSSVSEIEISSNGKIWVATAPFGTGRVCLFDPKTGGCTVELQAGQKEAIMGLTLDEKGNPVFATDFGIYAYDGKLVKPFIHDNYPLKSNFVDEIAEGPDGKLWISTDGGIQLLHPAFQDIAWETFTLKTYPDMGGNWASAVAMAPDGSTWFAMMNGSASHYSKGQWTTFPDLRNYETVAVDQQNRGWFGDDSNGIIVMNPDGSVALKFTQLEGLPGNRINALLQDGNTMWIGTENGLAKYANNKLESVLVKGDERLPYPYIRDLAVDTNHHLLIGSSMSVVRWDGTTAKTILNFDDQGITEWLTELAVASNGRIWVGTGGKGMYFSDNGTSWTHMGTEDGLLTNYISALHIDEFGSIWIGGGGSNFDGGGLMQIVP